MSVKTKQVDTWYTDRLRSTFTNCIFIKHNNKLTWRFFFFQHKIISIHWSIVRVNRLSAIMWNGVFNYNMWNVVVINGIVTLSFFPKWWYRLLQIAPSRLTLIFKWSFTLANSRVMCIVLNCRQDSPNFVFVWPNSFFWHF